METALAWSWLNVMTKKRYEALKTVYGDLSAALMSLDEELLQGLSCKEDTIYKVLNRWEEFDAEAYQAALTKRGVNLITIEDESYPVQLKATDDPPVFLYYRGDLSILQQPCLALVGTRKMSDYGRRVTEQCARAGVEAGLVIVSGLASGVDTVAAQAALDARGRTAAVLAHGLANIYPAANKRLAEAIIEGGGVVLTEFPLDQRPDTYTFPARNRIVAGLSLATAVMEAPEGSGALITADLAAGYGRDVFAVPGPVFEQNYAGCHRIIHSGQAKLLMSSESMLRDIGIVRPKKPARSRYEPSTPAEEAIWSALTSMPQAVDDIMEKTGLAAGEINATLTIMELQGVVEQVGSRQWVRG